MIFPLGLCIANFAGLICLSVMTPAAPSETCDPFPDPLCDTDAVAEETKRLVERMRPAVEQIGRSGQIKPLYFPKPAFGDQTPGKLVS